VCKDLDQSSGKGLMPQRALARQIVNEMGNSYSSSSGGGNNNSGGGTGLHHPGLDITALKQCNMEEKAVQRTKQLTEQELFEAQQLIRSGILPDE